MTDAIMDSKKRQEKDENRSQGISGGLYLVATPIGNLRDITLRALDVLAGVDLILAEDTRHSRKLLDRHGLRTPMRPYHEHNADNVRDGILRALQDGQAIALISDAGTPLVSDPGFKLVRAVAEAGLRVLPIPGPSAVLAALCASGLPSDRFLFAGFAPAKQISRQKFFSEFVATPASLVFFESPNRLLASLQDMLEVFGPRPAVLARELTKIHETLVRNPLPQLIKNLSTHKIRGECVVVVGPPETQALQMSQAQIDMALIAAMERFGVKAAAREVAQITGLPMRELYAQALVLKQQS